MGGQGQKDTTGLTCNCVRLVFILTALSLWESELHIFISFLNVLLSLLTHISHGAEESKVLGAGGGLASHIFPG